MDHEEAKAIVESVLFVADAPLQTKKITSVFGGELAEEEIAAILRELAAEYEGRALMLAEVAEGWRIQTRPEYAAWITTFFKMDKGQRLSRASLEVLAIVAYRQPITRAEMDEIRGVDCGGVLRGLIDKSLVKTMGRRRAPGKPMMYGTTPKFLEFFGLARLSDLPTLEEFRAELGDTVDKLAATQPGLPFEGTEQDDQPELGQGEGPEGSGLESGQDYGQEETEEPALSDSTDDSTGGAEDDRADVPRDFEPASSPETPEEDDENSAN